MAAGTSAALAMPMPESAAAVSTSMIDIQVGAVSFVG